MKKEKYIYERKTKKGSPYFQIQIAFKDEYGQSKTFYESVQISDYESKSQAKAVAIAIRDKALYMRFRPTESLLLLLLSVNFIKRCMS